MTYGRNVDQLVRSFLQATSKEEREPLLHELQPFDVAEMLEELLEEEQLQLLASLPRPFAAEVLEHLDHDYQYHLLRRVDESIAQEILAAMPSDAISDLIRSLHRRQADILLNLLSSEARGQIHELLSYPEDSAGALANVAYLRARDHWPASQVLEHFRKVGQEAGIMNYAYVVDSKGGLSGVASLRDLLLSDGRTPVSELMHTSVVSVEADTDQEEAARLLEEYDFAALPVVDSEGRMVGIITHDDILDVVEEEATEDIYRKGGLSISDLEMVRSERLLQASLLNVLRVRFPWLLFVLVGGLVAGMVIGRFEATLEAVVGLAFFIPVIMDMGGNVGTQASTIFVRGLILGHIEPQRVVRYILREMASGLTMGGITGVAAGAVAALWQGDIRIGLVVFLALTLTCGIASLVGFGFPWLLHRMGFDPAAASDPLITTVKDITGLIIYFTLATTLLTRAGV